MLLEGGGEVMSSIRAQGIVVIVRGGRVQRRVDGRDAGIGDGRGGQSGILVEVVLGVHLLVLVGDAALVARQGVQQGRVDVQHAVGAVAAGIRQTVVDHRGDVGLIGAVGLLLNEGGDGDDLLQAVFGGLHLLHPLPVHLAAEVVQQAVQRGAGLFAHVEIVGVREQIALQAGQLMGIVVNEVVGEIILLGGLRQGLLGVDALAGQQRDGLLHRVALRNGDPDRLRRQVAGGVVHGRDQGHVIHVAVQGVGADADLLLRLVHPAEQLEEPLVVHQPRVVELVRDGTQIVVRRHFYGGLHRSLIERAEVVDQQPAHTGQHGGYHQHKQDIEKRVHPASPPTAAVLRLGRGTSRPLPDPPGIPACGILISIIGHTQPPMGIFK